MRPNRGLTRRWSRRVSLVASSPPSHNPMPFSESRITAVLQGARPVPRRLLKGVRVGVGILTALGGPRRLSGDFLSRCTPVLAGSAGVAVTARRDLEMRDGKSETPRM